VAERYHDVIGRLRLAYDRGAADRDGRVKEPWKLAERASFLRRLQDESCRRLLEVGAGTGQDGAFFLENGLAVVATDLSAEMVARCRAKGLDAFVMDFLHLDFPPGSFDAAYAMNCLLHVPDADLPAVLRAVRAALRPGGLFFLGVYGGRDEEQSFPDDSHDPPRFFAFRSDERIQRFARESFEIVDFHAVEPRGWRFQSLTLRRPGAPAAAAG
jgi:SAM-dependent methyltransferase